MSVLALLDAFIRLGSLFEYSLFATFRGPLERHFGTWRYISLLFGAREVYANFATLPEEVKRKLRRIYGPLLLLFVISMVLP
jgi:hypothetical protein